MIFTQVYDSFRINVEYEGNDVTMFIYDSAGQEDYDRIRPLDYAGADVVLYWYNVTSPDSYDNIVEKVILYQNYISLIFIDF